MTQDTPPIPDDGGPDARRAYSAPEMQYLGTLAELTQMLPPDNKEVGAADGATFLGIDIGPLS